MADNSNKTTRSLKRMTASEQVAEQISHMILSGELTGGQKIRQEAIAEQLGVSRIPVREALRQLEASGLVVNQPHRGAYVATLSVDDAHDLFSSRLIIEPTLVARATERRTDDDVAAATAAMEAYEQAILNGHPEPEINVLNWQFHLALMEPSKMTRLLGFVDTLLSSADRYLRLQLQPEEARERAIEDHRQLVNAFKLRLEGRARDLTRDHIMAAREETIIWLGKFGS